MFTGSEIRHIDIMADHLKLIAARLQIDVAAARTLCAEIQPRLIPRAPLRVVMGLVAKVLDAGEIPGPDFALIAAAIAEQTPRFRYVPLVVDQGDVSGGEGPETDDTSCFQDENIAAPAFSSDEMSDDLLDAAQGVGGAVEAALDVVETAIFAVAGGADVLAPEFAAPVEISDEVPGPDAVAAGAPEPELETVCRNADVTPAPVLDAELPPIERVAQLLGRGTAGARQFCNEVCRLVTPPPHVDFIAECLASYVPRAAEPVTPQALAVYLGAASPELAAAPLTVVAFYLRVSEAQARAFCREVQQRLRPVPPLGLVAAVVEAFAGEPLTPRRTVARIVETHPDYDFAPFKGAPKVAELLDVPLAHAGAFCADVQRLLIPPPLESVIADDLEAYLETASDLPATPEALAAYIAAERRWVSLKRAPASETPAFETDVAAPDLETPDFAAFCSQVQGYLNPAPSKRIVLDYVTRQRRAYPGLEPNAREMALIIHRTNPGFHIDSLTILAVLLDTTEAGARAFMVQMEPYVRVAPPVRVLVDALEQYMAHHPLIKLTPQAAAAIVCRSYSRYCKRAGSR
ncbi:MAG: hypothetical protein JXB35_12665 [Anaerolineae bacterium]|nr:hypothetical protein [Anaerolineae bacterium]